MTPDDHYHDSPILEPQWNRPCPFCGTVLSGVWPDEETAEVTVKECYNCGDGPVHVERELE